MPRFMKKVRHVMGKDTLARDERGLSTVEYVIILVLIAAAGVALWNTFGATIREKLGTANDTIESGVNVDGQGSGDAQ